MGRCRVGVCLFIMDGSRRFSAVGVFVSSNNLPARLPVRLSAARRTRRIVGSKRGG